MSEKQYTDKESKEIRDAVFDLIRKHHNDDTKSVIHLAELNGRNIIYGKFGYHNGESPLDIIKRKLPEVKVKVDGLSFGLWGVGSKSIKIEDVRKFCEAEKAANNEVYLIAKFTRDKKQKEATSSHKYTNCNMNGKKINLTSRKIIVQGSEQQNYAFVVEDYFMLDQRIAEKKFHTFYKVYNNPNANTCTFTSNYLLENNKKLDLEDKGDWAIVLKLKDPYIVECYV